MFFIFINAIFYYNLELISYCYLLYVTCFIEEFNEKVSYNL